MKISISGTIGSGKSTVSKILSQRLGCDFYSIGGFMREMARERVMGLDELTEFAGKSDEIDRELDRRQMELNKSYENFVIDSRLGYYFIPDSFKVFLSVEFREGVKRVVRASRNGERYSGFEEAKILLNRRMKSEKNRYKEYYGLNFLDERNFDLIIDTTFKTPYVVAEEILGAAEDKFKLSTKPKS